MRLIAALFAYPLFLLALPFLLFHPKLKDGLKARLGLHPPGWPGLGPGPRLWLHGASAGDILALVPLIRELKARRADLRLVLSTITNSGRIMAEKEARQVDVVTYLPYDLPGPVRRTLARIAPDVLVLEYTELWPQLIHAANRAQTKLVLHNGRLSANRVGRYRRLFFLVGNLLTPFRLLLMKDDAEAETARRLGATDQQLHVTGNTKFDSLTCEPPAAKVAELERVAAFPKSALVWVAGSTHEGEEEILLDTFATVRGRYPQLRLIVAPRYVERAEKILSLASRRGLTARLRSQGGPAPEVFVLDTIGELVACYALAHVVFVGGSFVTRGGQNILEPAAAGKPVLFGPHMQNFADSVQVLLGRGGIQVVSPEQLHKVMIDLLSRPQRLQELGELAATQVRTVRGAAGRNADLILGLR
ncbi:MAG: 3-deoxy-D-manno-octulosonic acid transferase [Deltaproteobacteria bacterium]|nr:3-deoxy-D-manno-octulosonic acid transferase [Deltaproteobacteria bacterium]